MFLAYEGKKNIYDIEKLIDNLRDNCEQIQKTKSDGIFINGDNFIGMARLLDNFENKIDLVYIDPPFNTNSKFYFSEEQRATISVSKDNAIAYHDDMAFNEYLEFMRIRLILIWHLLSEKGTLYIHIDCKVGHYIKILCDEIFGQDNFINDIARVKSNPKNFNRKAFGNERDMILVYSKSPKQNIFNNITYPLDVEEIDRLFPKVDVNGNRYTTVPCHAPGETKNGLTGSEWNGQFPPKGRHWRCSPRELTEMDKKGLIEWSKNGVPRIKKYARDHKGKKIQDVWINYKDPQYPIYPTEKNREMLSMIINQSSCENSIIMDCFCGSSSFLKEGVKNGRYVIGIDKSPISKKILKEELNLFFDINIIQINDNIKVENLI